MSKGLNKPFFLYFGPEAKYKFRHRAQIWNAVLGPEASSGRREVVRGNSFGDPRWDGEWTLTPRGGLCRGGLRSLLTPSPCPLRPYPPGTGYGRLPRARGSRTIESHSLKMKRALDGRFDDERIYSGDRGPRLDSVGRQIFRSHFLVQVPPMRRPTTPRHT